MGFFNKLANKIKNTVYELFNPNEAKAERQYLSDAVKNWGELKQSYNNPMVDNIMDNMFISLDPFDKSNSRSEIFEQALKINQMLDEKFIPKLITEIDIISLDPERKGTQKIADRLLELSLDPTKVSTVQAQIESQANFANRPEAAKQAAKLRDAITSKSGGQELQGQALELAVGGATTAGGFESLSSDLQKPIESFKNSGASKVNEAKEVQKGAGAPTKNNPIERERH